MLLQRIESYVADPASSEFGRLAIEAFAFQYESIAAYRRLCDGRGVAAGGEAAPASWRDIPTVPTTAFKTVRLAAAEAQEIFRSSGTTDSVRSEHHHPYPELYRQVVEASFPDACLAGGPPAPMLSLIPSRRQLPDSSLSFMIDHVVRKWGAEGSSRNAFGRHGVEATAARSWLAARQRDHRPALILATAFATVQLLDGLERLGLRFRLPPGSVLFETGGFKGRSREVGREELLERTVDRLSIPAERIVREYGMTELTSQFYTAALGGGDPDLFLPPHWTRVRVLDPETLTEQPEGEPGLICILDLANVGSAVHLLTEDLGVAEGEGFRWVGRAAGAELRGCSLTGEELGG